MSEAKKKESVIEKIFSRKLVAFLAATVALWLGVVDQNTWETVAVAYLGAQGLVDLTSSGINALAAKGKGKVWEKSEASEEPAE